MKQITAIIRRATIGTMELFGNTVARLALTWIGVDGATITFEKGILIASRGMGDDVMNGHTEMPS